MADENESENQEGEEKSGGLGKKLLFAGVAVVLVAVGAFAGLTFMGGNDPEVGEDGEPIAEGESEEDAEAKGAGPVFYTALAPPLVVNFKDRIGDDHVMQVSLEMMARDQATINEVREHSPLIRSSLILLYSSYIYEDIASREGKQMMLDDGLSEIQRLMEMRIGKPAIEELYFTGLVIQ
ncbi:MAG: flagellar basal body-associated FliL family protein [Pseudomonadota bacterium]